ncbi:MAG: glycosyltransferase [Campylobacterales bacterium]|nr:glycosyltransferase [Campylobacterales bacterium]
MIRLSSYLLLAFFTVVFIQIVPSGPDAQLYVGLAENLLNGTGYFDTIRHDEILPPVGYPLMISLALKMGISGYWFTLFLLVVSFVILFEAFENLKINVGLSLALIFVFIQILTPLNIWGMEAALIFSGVLLFYTLTLMVRHQNLYTFIFFATALLISVLIRPILMPFAYLTVPVILYLLIQKSMLRKEMIGALLLFFGSLVAIGNYSYAHYGDKRLLSGTYSEIPLYCAWNRYIPLTQAYRSSSWKDLPSKMQEMAVKPLQNVSGWKERADLLKREVVRFVIDEPSKAIGGYCWRLSKYTVNADNELYALLFFLWMTLSLMLLSNYKKLEKKFKVIWIFSFTVTSYIIAVTAVFVYVDSRYYVTPALFMVFSSAFLLYSVKNNRDARKMKEKSILFLSANDFKEKSIQVIRKTPEAYVQHGWDVNYIVARDNSKSGNYFYEKEINPEGVKITRFYMPFAHIKDRLGNHVIKTVFSKIIGYITIMMLVKHALKIMKEKNISVVYGYEMHGVLAANILKWFTFRRNYRFVNRFMGTWLTQYYEKKQYAKLLLNLDHMMAIRSASDLCIMTDDGTMGDKAMRVFNSKSLHNFKFWVNGVNEQKLGYEAIESFRKQLGLRDEAVFLTVSRLEGWKRVDRAIQSVAKLKNRNFKYFIIGEGVLKNELQRLVETLNLQDNVVFVGAIPNETVKQYLNVSDYFLSMYDLSNVGNPLLEAIRANKIIFTLNNGDTSNWIKHRKNGFIYDIDENLYENIAKDMEEVMNDSNLKNAILENIRKTEKERLWTWDERMDAEVKEVEKLLDGN